MLRMLSYPDWLKTIATAEAAVWNIGLCAVGTVAAMWLISRYSPRLLPYARFALVIMAIGLIVISVGKNGL